MPDLPLRVTPAASVRRGAGGLRGPAPADPLPAGGAAGAVLAAALLCAAGCGHVGGRAGRELVWSGEVRIAGGMEIPPGTTLVIRPGTRVLFEARDEDGDGLGDAGLVAHGEVRAEGRPGEEIVFDSAPGNPIGWGEVRVEDAPRALFRRCAFSGAQTALHVHRTRLEVDRCGFRANGIGVRFTGGPVLLRRSRFEANGTAVRYWESAPEILSNRFADNDTAVFVREGSRGGRISGNDFRASRDYHVKLGESQQEDVAAPGNRWGTEDDAEIERLLYDRADAEYLGRVLRDGSGAGPAGPPPR